MEYRRLGRSDLQVSVISLGCWPFSGGMWGDVDDKESIATVHWCLDHGVNFLDTAEAYGDGRSEEVVGRALKGRRDKAIVATKVSHDYSKEGVMKAAAGSLRRLQTDYIDLYQIHGPSPKVPFSETMEALLKLKEQGKIRCIGVSNFDMPQMKEALQSARFESLQPPYSLLWRHIEGDILPFCRGNEIGVIAYSPLVQGLLTGKFTKESKLPEGDVRNRCVLFKGEPFERSLEVVEALRKIAKAHGKTIGQAALNWLIAQPGVTSAIVGAKRPSQIEENAGAADWRLSEHELQQLRRLSEPVMALVKNEKWMWKW
jgi:aryl-alcohol dehydrogenase-like predicted oxidoreductase